MDDLNQTSVENAEANSQETVQEQVDNGISDTVIDYEVKFKESQKEALRLLEENKRLKESQNAETSYSNNSEDLVPGFDELDEEQQRNLVEYTNMIERRTLDRLNQDPAISYARSTYNEKKWDDAFSTVANEFPELKDLKSDFKSQYFKADNVPDNIDSLLRQVASAYLVEKGVFVRAGQAQEFNERIDIERSKGGDKTPTTTRSLEDWQRMAASNPVEFARLSKQFNEDMESGRLK